ARVLARPVADQPPLAHDAAHADIFAPVLPGIADAHDAAVGRDEAAGTLDLEEEELDRIRHPGDLQPAAGERALLDLRAIVVEYEIAVLVVAAEGRTTGALAFGHVVGPGADQIARHGVDRNVVAGDAGAAAADRRLEVAGGEGRAIAGAGGFEILLEEIVSAALRPGARRVASGAPTFGASQPARIRARQQPA